GTRGHEPGEVARERDRRRAKACEDHRFARARKSGEPACQIEPQTALDDDVQVGVRAAVQAVAHVSADDPRARPQLGCGLLQEPADPLVGYGSIRYWLIRAHSTAPTWPARSPNRARRTLGRRAGLMNGDERSVSSIVGATSFQERVTPPPSTNIPESIPFGMPIRGRPHDHADPPRT